jgi:hypothetical protein
MLEKKQCFNCKKYLILDKFSLDRRKYQLPPDKGRCKVCIKCDRERSIKNMSTIRFNFEENKFETIEFKSINQINIFYKNEKINQENMD